MQHSIIVTIGGILCWALLAVVSRILLLRFAFDPWSFSFVQLCAGGSVLLAVSARQGLPFRSFARPATWILGMLRVLSAALYTALLVWVSVLEAGVLGATNVPVIAMAAWVVLQRRPARGEWLGHLVILLAALVLAGSLESDIRAQAVGLSVLNAICLAAITLLAERHPENVSDAPGVRLGFTGAVLMVTAAITLAIRMAQGDGGADEIDWSLLIAGAAVGTTLRAPSMVLSFWSIRLVGAQGYAAAIALLPLFGMVFEQAAVATGLLAHSRFETATLILALIALAGTSTILVMRARRAPGADPGR